MLISPASQFRLLSVLVPSCLLLLALAFSPLAPATLFPYTLPKQTNATDESNVNVQDAPVSPEDPPISPASSDSPVAKGQADPATLRQLTEHRHQLHLHVKNLERSSTGLRQRIWFLEDHGATLRADITRRTGEYAQLMKVKDGFAGEINGLIAERDDLVNARDSLARERDALCAERSVLLASKQVLVEDLEELHAELAEIVAEKQALLEEKTAVEKRLAVEVAKVGRAETVARQLQDECRMLQAQMASKQETLNELMNENDFLEEDLQTSKKNLMTVLIDTQGLRTTNDSIVAENEALKGELKILRSSPHTTYEDQALELEAELHETTRALQQLRDDHEIQTGCLKLARTALSVASDDRIKLRATLDGYRAHQRVSDDLEDTLATALEERDVQIVQLKAALAAREVAAKTIADLQTYIASLEGAIEFLEARSSVNSATMVNVPPAVASTPAPASIAPRMSPHLYASPVSRSGLVSMVSREPVQLSASHLR